MPAAYPGCGPLHVLRRTHLSTICSSSSSSSSGTRRVVTVQEKHTSMHKAVHWPASHFQAGELKRCHKLAAVLPRSCSTVFHAFLPGFLFVVRQGLYSRNAPTRHARLNMRRVRGLLHQSLRQAHTRGRLQAAESPRHPIQSQGQHRPTQSAAAAAAAANTAKNIVK
jgi:hypothetical protein